MTKSELRLLARMERAVSPSRADVAKLCAMVREFDDGDHATTYVGSTVRTWDAMISRVLAGEHPNAILADYEFEWSRGPDLGPIVRLVELREAVRDLVAVLAVSPTVDLCSTRTWPRLKKALKRAGGAGRKG